MASLLVSICPMKLRIIPDSQRIDSIKIVDDKDSRVICIMRYQDIDLAHEFVRRHNGWWYFLFGGPRDERQKQYDRWISQR